MNSVVNIKPSILYVDDELPNLSSFMFVFRDEFDVHVASSAKEGLDILRSNKISIVITDQRMPGITGVELLEKVRELHPSSFRMVLTGYSDMDAIVDAINKGHVYHYFSKPWDELEMKLVISNALETIAIEERLTKSHEMVNELIEQAPDALILADEAGRIKLFNKQAEHMFGFNRAEIKGQLIEQLIPSRFVGHDVKRNHYISNPEVRHMGIGRELTAITKHGDEFPVEISLSPLSTSEGMMVTAAVRDISVRKQVEGELRDVEARRDLALEAAKIGTWDWDMLLDSLTWDDRMFEIYGCDPAEELSYDMFDAYLHPDDRERVLGEVSVAAEGKGDFLSDYRIVLPDKSIRYINAMGRMHLNEEGVAARMIGVCIDISERKLVEQEIHELNEHLERRVEERTNELQAVNEELRKSERRAQLLRKVVSDASAATSVDEVLKVALESLIKYSGWPIAHSFMIDSEQHNSMVSVPDWAAQIPDAITEFIHASENIRFEIGVGLPGSVLKECQPVYISDIAKTTNFPRKVAAVNCGIRSAVAFPIILEGEVVAAIELFSLEPVEADTLFQKTIHQVGNELGFVIERKTAEQKMIAAMEAADNANRAKSAFLATMSHEIRTPMNGVIGMIDLLRQSRMTEDQTQMMDTIRDSAFSLLKIIDDILDFSKIEAGKLTLEQFPVDLCHLVEGVEATLSPVARKKSIRLHSFIDPMIPRTVTCDQVRIRQVLFNLAGNAIKFTDNLAGRKGEVVIRADLQESPPGEYIKVCFRVIDNGIGISTDAIEDLFQPFLQAESATTRRYGGTGLGLSICSRLTELMGGKIEVESQLNQGSQFSVTLQLPTAFPVDSENVLTDLSGLRVLVVPVGESLGQFLVDYLNHSGAEGVICRDHREVASLAKEAACLGKPFDVVVLGNCWDKSTKTDLRLLFRRQDELSGTRFVVITDRSESLTELDCPDSVIIKGDPLSREGFLRSVAISMGRASPEMPVISEVDILPIENLQSQDEAEAAGLLVLIAEDNETNQVVISRQLNLLGYTSQCAANGQEAFRMWQRHSYGLLLSDCHMPEMDGFELTREIRLQEADIRVPIIAITANVLQGEAERCLEAGMDDYLPKPVELIELKRMLQKWLPLKGQTARRNKKKNNVVPQEGEIDRTIIDLSVLSSLTGNDPSLNRLFIKKYIDTAPAMIGAIHSASKSQDAAAVAGAAHKFKSSARAIGANTLAELCEHLESAGNTGELGEIKSLRKHLDAEAEAVLKFISDLIAGDV